MCARHVIKFSNPLFGNQRILNLEVMAGRDIKPGIKLRSPLSKNIHFSRDFSHFRNNAFVSIFCSVQIISRLDSESSFQMCTLFSGRHIGGPSAWQLHTTRLYNFVRSMNE